jgi:hypothetical protein
VISFDPPSRSVILENGSMWHIGQNRQEILELDLFMTPRIEKHAPWEIEDRKSLVMTKGKSIHAYEIEIEDGDNLTYEMFYFHKFTGGEETEFLQFPEYLLEGTCVEIESSTVRYFLADTLFFDYLISETSSKESKEELIQNMTRMKKRWKELRGSR